MEAAKEETQKENLGRQMTFHLIEIGTVELDNKSHQLFNTQLIHLDSDVCY